MISLVQKLDGEAGKHPPLKFKGERHPRGVSCPQHLPSDPLLLVLIQFNSYIKEIQKERLRDFDH